MALIRLVRTLYADSGRQDRYLRVMQRLLLGHRALMFACCGEATSQGGAACRHDGRDRQPRGTNSPSPRCETNPNKVLYASRRYDNRLD
jgi:hypothetical protein